MCIRDSIIRVPVIPTFNDTEAEIKEIAVFAAGLENVKELHLLPYHRLGTDKYKSLGRGYRLPDITPVSYTHLDVYKRQVSYLAAPTPRLSSLSFTELLPESMNISASSIPL